MGAAEEFRTVRTVRRGIIAGVVGNMQPGAGASELPVSRCARLTA